MRAIDADALMDDIKRDSKKAIEEGDKFGSFWLGYAAGLVIKQPTIQPEQCGDKSYALWKESYEELKRRMDELTSCSDIISRKATIDAVNNAFDRETLLTVFVRSIAVRAIRDMPTVQPEPHEGHWIKGKIYRDVIECNCSECGQLMTTAASVRMSFCPNCGAKMKGERQK